MPAVPPEENRWKTMPRRRSGPTPITQIRRLATERGIDKVIAQQILTAITTGSWPFDANEIKGLPEGDMKLRPGDRLALLQYVWPAAKPPDAEKPETGVDVFADLMEHYHRATGTHGPALVE